MQFVTMTDDEIKDSALLADGVYRANIFDAFDKDNSNNQLVTKNGNDKIQMICNVFDVKGNPRKINSMVTPAFIKLLKHLCDAIGLEKEYLSGNVSATDIRKKFDQDFSVLVGRRNYTKDATGEVVWVNQIDDYYKIDKLEAKSDKFNDDINF